MLSIVARFGFRCGRIHPLLNGEAAIVSRIRDDNAPGIKHGILHAFEDKKVPLANRFVSMLNSVGVPVGKFADSTGPKTEILA